MSKAKRVLAVVVCVIGLVLATNIAASAGRAQASGEQPKIEVAQSTIVFLAEASLVEVPSQQLYASGADPISMGGRTATVEMLSKCLKNQSARVTAGLKALILDEHSANMRDARKIYFATTKVKANPENVTMAQYDASTVLDLNVRSWAGGMLVGFDFAQSLPIQKADEIPTIRNLKWESMTLVKDATPTIIASQLDAENAVFLVLCVKRLDLGRN
jgi:hypothetical protein